MSEARSQIILSRDGKAQQLLKPRKRLGIIPLYKAPNHRYVQCRHPR